LLRPDRARAVAEALLQLGRHHAPRLGLRHAHADVAARPVLTLPSPSIDDPMPPGRRPQEAEHARVRRAVLAADVGTPAVQQRVPRRPPGAETDRATRRGLAGRTPFAETIQPIRASAVVALLGADRRRPAADGGIELIAAVQVDIAAWAPD